MDVTVSISIPFNLLTKIDQLEGLNRNDKLLKCILRGYEILTKPKR